jgi:hypothetical protein
MKKSVKTYLPLLSLFAILLSTTAQAGIYWESEVTTKGIPNRPDATSMQKHYFTLQASRTESSNGQVTIMNFDTMTVYHLDPASKTYRETKLNELADKMSKMDEAHKKMMGMSEGIQVTPTEETKTIEGYKCKKFDVSAMSMKSEYWVTKDVEVYDELKAIWARLAKSFEANPMLSQMNVMGVMNKMQGFPIQTVTQVMGGQTISTVKKIEKKNPSEDLFKVPQGYTLKETPQR